MILLNSYLLFIYFIFIYFQGIYISMSPTTHERILNIDKYNANKY